jgi:capsular polysaccharide transport system ATP-binding protein
MIAFLNVVDRPVLRGYRLDLALGINLLIPKGRYALLSPDLRLRRPMLDLLAGVRPPASGAIRQNGLVSWPIGRAGFTRGKVTGFHLLALLSRIYSLDRAISEAVVGEILTNPDCLGQIVDHWDSSARFEFLHAVALLPRFDIYIVDGALPVAGTRFHRLWWPLFEQRLSDRTFVLLTTRAREAEDYCDAALVLRNGLVEIDDELDQALGRYPARPLEMEERSSGGGSELFEDDQLV